MRKRSQLGLMALAAIGVVLWAKTAAPEPHGYIGTYVWTLADARFGGISAIEMSPDGRSFIALSDNSTLFTARLTRDENDRINGVTDAVLTTLNAPNGLPFTHNRDDSEGLAIAPDGTFFISQEGPARVLHYASATAAATVLPTYPDFAGLQKNASLESLAIDPDGTLYSVPERSGALNRPFPLYRFRDGQWDQPFTIPRIDEEFLPVAADFGPDGRLYILERDFRGLLGFESRIRRFVIDGDSISSGETVLQTPAGAHQNLEGLSVWRDATGAPRATMVSDDNFRFFLGTTLVEYRLPD